MRPLSYLLGGRFDYTTSGDVWRVVSNQRCGDPG
jgi:hypothetical protein